MATSKLGDATKLVRSAFRNANIFYSTNSLGYQNFEFAKWLPVAWFSVENS